MFFHESMEKIIRFSSRASRLRGEYLLLVFVVSVSSAFSAPLTTGADFLLLTTGARPDGMGQAFSAVADDINTLSFNPAGLGNIRLPEAGYSHVPFLGDTSFDFIGAALPVGGLGVFGFGYVGLTTTPFNSTADPLAPALSAGDRAFIGGWGRSFYDFQVGFAAKYITRQVDTIQGNGFAFDAGIRFRILPTLSLSAAGLNVGPGIQMSSLEPLPTVLNAGAAWEPFEDSNHSLSLSAEASYNVTTQIQRYGFGAEYWFKNLVALRAGYLANSPDEGFSAGAGVQLSFVELDYAFQPYATLGPVHRFSGLLRWDGPWVSGGEPNAPRFVNVTSNPGLVEVRWEKSVGPAMGYEVTLQPLDGRDATVSPLVVNPYFIFKQVDPATLYKISVRTVGNGGSRSYPSPETYVESSDAQPGGQGYPGQPGISIAHGIEGKVDLIGLRLIWTTPPGLGEVGYNLYRRSPQGRIEKITQEPKKDAKLWITDTSGLEGYKWIVTIVDSKGREGTLGSYEYHPTAAETEMLSRPPNIRLFATSEPNHQIFLDWDQVPGVESYSLFVSRKEDGVYQLFRNLSGGRATLLMRVPRRNDRYFFLLVPNEMGGEWVRKSNEVEVRLNEVNQWVVPGGPPVRTVK